MKTIQIGFLLLIGFFTFVGCSIGNTESPEQGARGWFDGLSAMDGFKVEDRTCKAKQDELKTAGLFATMVQLFGQSQLGEKVKIDTSNVNIEGIRTNGDTAEVRITGRLRAGIGLAVNSQDLLSVWKMVRENGRWKYCGEDREVTATVVAMATATATASHYTPADVKNLQIQENDFPVSTRLIANPVEKDASWLFQFRKEGDLKSQAIYDSSYSFLDNNVTLGSNNDVHLTSTLFETPEDTEKGLSYFRDFAGRSKPKNPTTAAALMIDDRVVEDLGEGGWILGLRDSKFEIFHVGWRVENVGLWLIVGSKPGSLKESDVLGVANNLTKRLEDNRMKRIKGN